LCYVEGKLRSRDGREQQSRSDQELADHHSIHYSEGWFQFASAFPPVHSIVIVGLRTGESRRDPYFKTSETGNAAGHISAVRFLFML
jgi:hypothetical protein